MHRYQIKNFYYRPLAFKRMNIKRHSNPVLMMKLLISIPLDFQHVSH